MIHHSIPFWPLEISAIIHALRRYGAVFLNAHLIANGKPSNVREICTDLMHIDSKESRTLCCWYIVIIVDNCYLSILPSAANSVPIWLLFNELVCCWKICSGKETLSYKIFKWIVLCSKICGRKLLSAYSYFSAPTSFSVHYNIW